MFVRSEQQGASIWSHAQMWWTVKVQNSSNFPHRLDAVSRSLCGNLGLKFGCAAVPHDSLESKPREIPTEIAEFLT
jgi:hypothetical protein